MKDLSLYTAREMNRIKWTLRELHEINDKAYKIYSFIEDYAEHHDDECIKKFNNRAAEVFEDIQCAVDYSETRLFEMYADMKNMQKIIEDDDKEGVPF